MNATFPDFILGGFMVLWFVTGYFMVLALLAERKKAKAGERYYLEALKQLQEEDEE